LIVGVHARGREGKSYHLEVGDVEGLEQFVLWLVLGLIGGVCVLRVLQLKVWQYIVTNVLLQVQRYIVKAGGFGPVSSA